MPNGLILGLMTALFLTLGYLGVPVAFALIAGVLVGTLFTPITLQSIVAQLFNGIDSEALMAIPFFLLVGELMTSANVVIRIAELSQALVGHIRGGLAQVTTVFSMFFSGMSGSSSADVAVLSRTHGEADGAGGLRPRLRRRADRRRLDHRQPGAAVDHGGGLRRDRQCLDRRAVPGRHRAGLDDRLRADDLLLFLRPRRLPPPARQHSASWRRRRGRRRCR